MIKKYDICFAEFPFEDTGEIKARPVLILDNGECALLSAKITSKVDKYNGKMDYHLVDWESEGLKKPSLVRLDKRENISPEQIYFKVGRLSTVDRENVEKILNESKAPSNEELKMDESIIPGVEEGWKQLVEHSEEDFVDKAEEADQIEANVGIAGLLSNLIQGEWQTINDYNVAIKNARAEGLDDVADIMANIVKDENTHVGNLETAMKLVTNEAEHIEDGEKEAEGIIDGNEELGIEPNNEFDLSLVDDDVDELSRLLGGLGM